MPSRFSPHPRITQISFSLFLFLVFFLGKGEWINKQTQIYINIKQAPRLQVRGRPFSSLPPFRQCLNPFFRWSERPFNYKSWYGLLVIKWKLEKKKAWIFQDHLINFSFGCGIILLFSFLLLTFYHIFSFSSFSPFLSSFLLLSLLGMTGTSIFVIALPSFSRTTLVWSVISRYDFTKKWLFSSSNGYLWKLLLTR